MSNRLSVHPVDDILKMIHPDVVAIGANTKGRDICVLWTCSSFYFFRVSYCDHPLSVVVRPSSPVVRRQQLDC